MRAHEFITENEMHQWQKDALPGLKSLNDDSYYELYRLGITMAGAGRDDANQAEENNAGPAADNSLTLSYSDADEDIINLALKKHGLSARNVTPTGSREPKDTMTLSPVANLGPVKRKNT